MWFPGRWTKIQKADIPLEKRTEFENMGVAVVSQALSRDIVIPGPWMFTIPWERPGPSGPSDNDYAWAWLREQHTREDRRRDIGEFTEILIVFLVGVEALPVFLSGAVKVGHLILLGAIDRWHLLHTL